MRTPSLSKKILSAWVINKDKGGSHMNVEDIASAVFGEYLFATKSKNRQIAQQVLLDSVRTNICHAIELAGDHGIQISTKRKAIAADPTKKHRIQGWRIFVKGEDEEYLIDELNYKKRNGEARINSFNKLRDSVIDKGLLAPDEIKELKEGIG